MDAADRSTLTGTETAVRKTWTTPVVIVESASRNTLAFSTLGADVAYTTGVNIGS